MWLSNLELLKPKWGLVTVRTTREPLRASRIGVCAKAFLEGADHFGFPVNLSF
jgi:hypothetical protein